MILKLIILSMMSVHTLGQTPSANTYLLGISQLIPKFKATNLFDGPSAIANAPTVPTTTRKPTLSQMMYYNYYTGSVNCAYTVLDLSCDYCQYIKGDISNYTVLQNDTHLTSALVALSKSRDEIVIAYRASENFWNFVLDATLINYTPIQGSKLKIHKGFFIALMSLYDNVVKTVNTLRSIQQTSKIVITGHSLGAAMARLTEFFFISLKQFPGIDLEVYTFGEPRNGNKYYVDYLNSKSLITARITASADIVPHIPPVSMLGTTIFSDYYLQVETEYWINGTDGQKFCNKYLYEDPKCSSILGPLYSALDHFTYFDVDHFKCIGDVQEFLAFPVIFQPVDDFPHWPKFISDVLSDGTDEIVKIISPILGR